MIQLCSAERFKCVTDLAFKPLRERTFEHSVAKSAGAIAVAMRRH